MTSPSSPQFLGLATPAQVFRQRCREWGPRPALSRKRLGLWEGVSWQGYYEHTRAVGLALAELGLVRGSIVCVLAENRCEWLYADLGAQCMGMVGNGIYPTSSQPQVQHVLVDSGAAVVFVENQEQLEKVLAVRSHCPALRRVVVMEREGLRGLQDAQIEFFDDFLARGMALAATQACLFEDSINAGQASELAFLVYTSGTTGAPKGAMVLNRNVVFQMGVAASYLNVQPGDRSVSFLPLCHIAERMASVFNPLAMGLVVHFPENAGTVFNDTREVAPHVLFAPPRFWEKLQSQIELFMRDAVAPARWLYGLARRRSAAFTQAQLEGRPLPRSLPLKLLQALAFHHIRVFLGLHQVKSALTGAAPVPPELVRWFMDCGIELREAFGMTETCGFCTATPAGGVRLGWAGLPAPHTEVRLGPQDEIWVRGDNVFGGYWGQPERTRDAIDADGWLHTGDCGEINAQGYLAVRDRIKDILITSAGKNITPSHIESQLKFSPFITDAVVIGDGRHYLTCLIMIDQEHVSRFAQDQQVPYTDFASLTRAPEVRALLQQEVDKVNTQLARVEQIKHFELIPQLLTAEDEELTPTMKLKRKVVAVKYAPLIELMYAGGARA